MARIRVIYPQLKYLGNYSAHLNLYRKLRKYLNIGSKKKPCPWILHDVNYIPKVDVYIYITDMLNL